MDGKKHYTRSSKRERSREKLNDNINNQKSSDTPEVLNKFSLTLSSNTKTQLEEFVEMNIKKKYNKNQFEFSFKKQKSKFIYNFLITEKYIIDEIINQAISSDLYKNKEIQIFLDDHEIKPEIIDLKKEINFEVKGETNKEMTDIKNEIHNQEFSDIGLINPLQIDDKNFKSNQIKNVREIIVENIPEKLSNEKVYEIFFVFGDISKMEFDREQKRALITYKFYNSAEKANFKLNLEKNKTKNLNVKLSELKNGSNLAEDEFQIKEGKVIYMKFSDADKVPEKEIIKKSLKRYGLVTKIFRKKESKSYYIELSSDSCAKDIINDYKTDLFQPNYLKDLIQIDYAFNKSNKIVTEQPNPEEINQLQPTESSLIEHPPTENFDLNPHNYWQVYYDNTYNKNYYYNPFLNESVWELPEGAKITPFQDYHYDQHNETHVLQEVNNLQEKEVNYYDDEAWEEDELMEKMVWDKMREQQLTEWMKRPARQQVSDTRKDTAYVEGNYDYNIWYDKYLTDRKEEKEKIPSLHKCNAALDTGYTKADIQEKEGGAYFCLFFAKGCCSEGVNCRYYHRVPTKEDAEKIENLRDVFGRSRFANHRNDMGGVGTFSKECRSLFISDLKTIEGGNPVKEMVRILYENFSPWGEIEDLNYIPTKATCFIRYSHRCFAEFAKEATMGQSLVGEEVITVKWAYGDPDPMNKLRIEKENKNKFLSAYQKKQDNLKYARSAQSIYHDKYQNMNNPYSFNYSSGYGYEEIDQNNYVTDKTTQMTQNCIKLSETLRMIEENLNDEN